MKKIIFYIIALFALVSCQKQEVALTFGEKPEVRMDERLTELRDLLMAAPNGWKTSINTGGKGAYGFYINFAEDMTCTMVGDLTSSTSETPSTSTYRVIWAMNASLVFDTFNYITMLQEPSSNFGGTAPHGYRSDIEFEYIKSSGDSIYMRGKKYQNDFILVKATAEEKRAYLDNILFTLKTRLDEYLSSHFNNYIEIQGIVNKVDINFSNADKTFTFQFINDNGQTESHVGKFNYEPSGMNFAQPVQINDVLFVRGTLVDNVLTIYDADGKAYIVQQNPSPIMPI